MFNNITNNRIQSSLPIYRYEPTLDRPSRVSDKLTFVRLAALLRSAEDGDAGDMLQLNAEIESKDLHLQSVARTRRMGLTRLEWGIEPASVVDSNDDEARADMAAAYVRHHLTGMVVRRRGKPIRPFAAMLKHLSSAIGPNLAALELVWAGPELVDILPIPSSRLTFDYNISQTVRVITREEPRGIEIQRHRFIVHVPDDIDEYPFTSTIAKAQAKLYLMKHLAMTDWQTFSELFGQPMRMGTYPSTAPADDKTALKNALTAMGTRFWGMVPEGMAIEIVESTNRQSQPYQPLIDWIERKQTIGYLGQTLTTDTTGATGTYAAASIHNEVRLDILEEDIEAEARTIEEQLFSAIVEFRWPGQRMPVPKFVRRFKKSAERVEHGQVLDTALNRLGMQIERSVAHEMLDIPEPERDDSGNAVNELLTPAAIAPFVPIPGQAATTGSPRRTSPFDGIGAPSSASGAPAEGELASASTEETSLNELTLGIERAARSGDQALVNVLRRRLAALLGVPPLPNLVIESADGP